MALINLTSEILTLQNQEPKSVDLTGWKLVSETGNQTYYIPSGTTITTGATLRVVSSSSATASAATLVWTTANIWTNTGDPGALYDASGNQVSRK